MFICPGPVAKVQGGSDREAGLVQIKFLGSQKSDEHLVNIDPVDHT